jgi:hypothetical protein
MTEDCTNWLPVLVRGDVTEWERKFCASLIAQTRKGRNLTDKQHATLKRIRDAFRDRTMREDEPVIESEHDGQ